MQHFEPSRVKPSKANIQPKSAGWPALLTASTFNRLGQNANSPGNRAYCYADLTVSSLSVAVTITSTHYAYLWRDGQAELVCVAWLTTRTVYPRTVTHLSTNPARHRVTLLMHPTMLPLHQTVTRFWQPAYNLQCHSLQPPKHLTTAQCGKVGFGSPGSVTAVVPFCLCHCLHI